MAYIDIPGLTRFKNAFVSHILADEYDTTKTYSINDYCAYQGKTYKCTTAIATAEAWNSAHWTEIKTLNELSSSDAIAVDYTITIALSDWTLSSGAYSYTWQNAALTANSTIEIFFGTSPRGSIEGDITCSKTTGQIVFSTTAQPTGNISFVVRVVSITADFYAQIGLWQGGSY